MTNEFVLQTFKVAFIAVIPLSNAETALDRIDRGQTEDRRRIDKRQTKNRQMTHRRDRGQTEDRQGRFETKLTSKLDFPGLGLSLFLAGV